MKSKFNNAKELKLTSSKWDMLLQSEFQRKIEGLVINSRFQGSLLELVTNVTRLEHNSVLKFQCWTNELERHAIKVVSVYGCKKCCYIIEGSYMETQP